MNPKPASTSTAVANYFIEKGYRIGGISPMKLEGLIYFAHGWYLAKNDQPLIDEMVEARQFGIVIPSISRRTSGHSYLRHPIKDEHGSRWYRKKLPRIDDPGLLAFLEKVWNRLWKYDQVYLARLVNNERTPWALIAYKFNNPFHKREEIPHETIQEYFMKDMMVEEVIDDKGQSNRDDGIVTKLPSITMENEKSSSDVTHNRFFGENLERVFYALKK